MCLLNAERRRSLKNAPVFFKKLLLITDKTLTHFILFLNLLVHSFVRSFIRSVCLLYILGPNDTTVDKADSAPALLEFVS